MKRKEGSLSWSMDRGGKEYFSESNGRRLRFWALVCLQPAVWDRRGRRGGEKWWACQLVMGETSQRGRGGTEEAGEEGGVVWGNKSETLLMQWRSWLCLTSWQQNAVTAAENAAITNCLDMRQSEANLMFLRFSLLPCISLQLTFTVCVVSGAS